jgi:tetratricopeptide (TPR) repeat protein
LIIFRIEILTEPYKIKQDLIFIYFLQKGRIFEYKQEYLQAKLCYQNALSLNPYHIQSLQQIALVLCQMQNFHLAEKMIRDAISLNSSLPESWHILARVLDYQNDGQSALKCYQTCLQLEATNPILPFSSLTRVL